MTIDFLNRWQVLKLDGKGAPRLGGKGRGNQFVTVKVDIPTSVSREEKELLQKLQVRPQLRPWRCRMGLKVYRLG